MKSPNQNPLIVLVIAAIIAIFLLAFGVDYFLTGYVPERHRTHHSFPALYGVNAILYGAFVIVMGFLPLLLFAKNTRQETVWATLAGISLLIAVYIRIYVF